MTLTFYDQTELFASPIEYDRADPVSDRPKGTVDFAPFWRSTAAAFGATAVIFVNSAGFTNPISVSPRIFMTELRPFPAVGVPAAHQLMGDRVRRLFRAIPLSASEKVADPDYGL